MYSALLRSPNPQDRIPILISSKASSGRKREMWRGGYPSVCGVMGLARALSTPESVPINRKALGTKQLWEGLGWGVGVWLYTTQQYARCHRCAQMCTRVTIIIERDAGLLPAVPEVCMVAA